MGHTIRGWTNTRVVVVGGGPAGIAAAVAASRTGARTTLIERYGWKMKPSSFYQYWDGFRGSGEDRFQRAKAFYVDGICLSRKDHKHVARDLFQNEGEFYWFGPREPTEQPGQFLPDDSDRIAVYLPMSYQLGGYTLFVPREAVQEIEGMSVDDEELAEAIEAMAESSDSTVEEVEEALSEHGQVEALTDDILRRKALDRIADAAIPVDADGNTVDLTPVTIDEDDEEEATSGDEGQNDEPSPAIEE